MVLIRMATYAYFSGCLKESLCSLCSETKEEDIPGRERGSGGSVGHLPEMHFRQAMQAADTQDTAGLSPSLNTDTAARLTAPTHTLRARHTPYYRCTHTTDCSTSLLCSN